MTPETSMRHSAPVRASVLLVDDTPANLIALGAVLGSLGVSLVEARSGQEAIQRVEQESFAVILLDVQMPVMDGFETARRIREAPNGREVPIVFLTAIHRDDQYIKRGYANGAADYITKPFDTEVLRARVRAFADLYRQREEAHRQCIETRTRERDEALRRLAAFERISTAALETDDLDAFLHTLLTVFRGAADCAESAAILLRRQDQLVVRASIGLMEEAAAMGMEVTVGRGFAGAIAASGVPRLLCGDDVAECVESPWLRRARLRALYGVPLVHDGEVLGVALIGSGTNARFTEAEMRLFRAMVDRAGWAVSRTHTRQRLYASLDATTASIAIFRAPAFVCEFANESFRASHGGRDVVGLTAPELGTTPEVLALFDRAMRDGGSILLDEHVVVADFVGNGALEKRVLRTKLHPMRDATGRPQAVLASSVDLTREVEAREHAQIANRMKDEFLATVSHELRTPLNAILGWTVILRRGAAKDPDSALDIIERNARSQTRIIDDVLDLSRMVRGQFRIELAFEEISHVLLAALEAVRPAAEAKGISLEVDIADDLPLLAIDAGRMQQVVWNILANAVKFSPGTGHVALRAARGEGNVWIRIEDDGQGIDPAFLPHVFEPFRQADGSSTRAHGGLGLGLAIARQLVQAHGGTIRAESGGLSRGSAFTIELPAKNVRLLEAYDGGKGDRAEPAARLDGVRILVVEDHEDTRTLLVESLERAGAIACAAGSAEEAIARVMDTRPQVIVSDIGMPEMDGYALIRRVRALPTDRGGATPAIALTAYTSAAERERALREGFQLHLPKPVDPPRLLARIAEALQRAPAASGT